MITEEQKKIVYLTQDQFDARETAETLEEGVEYKIISNDGIPSSDLSSAIQTSLGKADNSIQNTAFVNAGSGGNCADRYYKVIGDIVLCWGTTNVLNDNTDYTIDVGYTLPGTNFFYPNVQSQGRGQDQFANGTTVNYYSNTGFRLHTSTNSNTGYSYFAIGIVS